MNTREEQIRRCQKICLKIRAMHEDTLFIQKMFDELKLDISEIKIPLYTINLELQKYHDAARSRERDLDESQQNHFAQRESHMMMGIEK